ncbi:hypothetical protein QYM36_005794, partial [Artemia franciscana]
MCTGQESPESPDIKSNKKSYISTARGQLKQMLQQTSELILKSAGMYPSEIVLANLPPVDPTDENCGLVPRLLI